MIDGAALAAAPAPRARRPRLLPWAPLVTLALLIGPVAAGLAGTLAPAFGWLPGLEAAPGLSAPGLWPWRDLLAWPGLTAAARLSVTTGLLSTALSLALALSICAAWQGTRAFAAIERALSPLLSVPHAAAAFGLAFLIAPSGWIARAFSPWATGWTTPPDLLITQDPWGLSLTAALVMKETPFLLLMTLAALAQTDAQRARLTAQTMGYGRMTAWLKVVAPRVYPQIRLPVYAVLAYAMSVVDVAMILGPTTPRPLAAQVALWIADPDLALRFRAAAGAILQLLLVLGALGLWRLGEIAGARLCVAWSCAGGRGLHDGPARGAALTAAGLIAGAAALGLAGLALWSVAGLWTFPNALPDALSLRVWRAQAGGLIGAGGETALIGAAATLIALTLTLACLEAEHRHGVRPSTRALWLLYLPLIAPQVAFLFGLQTLAAAVGLDGSRAAVIAAHAVFVTPYVFLSLADPFRAWDARLDLVARSLGAGPDRVLWAVRLPMLLRPCLTAAAVGFAVSVGQYLPTLLIGGGRVATLTTEAVALASGGDRRVIGAFALMQMVAPFTGFALALAIPALVHRNRRGLRHGP
ncbi:MAG: ABC transporter permease [Rhodobacterales bacterium CG18_big_fil_WC_8_21_14_2_50_71_9]|nr:MAG: ABC transporter permease [Rhodobacterales bacterium CG18_big_fil_WC_8_21_14_2_50_71_9]